MIPVVSIVGRKNSGKTTFLIGLIKELKEKGYVVGTIKHIHHPLELSDIDKEGSDSFKHFKGGAGKVVISSKRLLVLFQAITEEKTIEGIVPLFSSSDIVLTEGFKKEKMPKIEVVREGEPMCSKEDNLVAIVSNRTFALDVPCFGLDKQKKLADFIEENFIKKRKEKSISLFIDDKKIPLNGFVQSIFKETMCGMIRALQGIPENPRKIEVIISE